MDSTTSNVAIVENAKDYPYVAFGGTFDPPQAGHIDALKQLLEAGHSHVVVAITAQNPFKTRKATPHEVRHQMLSTLIEASSLPLTTDLKQSGIYISTFQYERTYEFVQNWRSISNYPLAWAVGEELLPDLHRWAKWEEMNLPIVLLKERIPLHATEIREGKVAPDPSLMPIIRQNCLYGYSEE